MYQVPLCCLDLPLPCFTPAPFSSPTCPPLHRPHAQVTIADVIDTFADLMDENRPRRGRAAREEGAHMNWADVRQRLQERFGVDDFADLCVRLPTGQGTGMGMFITSMSLCVGRRGGGRGGMEGQGRDRRQLLQRRQGVDERGLLPCGCALSHHECSGCRQNSREAFGLQPPVLSLTCVCPRHALHPAAAVCTLPPAGMVSGWKSERQQVQAGVDRLALKYEQVAHKCGTEMREVGVSCRATGSTRQGVKGAGFVCEGVCLPSAGARLGWPSAQCLTGMHNQCCQGEEH